MPRKALAPRRSPPLPQLKLRIPDELRQQLEQAAKENNVSINREMATRLGTSFRAVTQRRFEELAADTENAWHHWADFFHKLEMQDELIDAASGLATASELPHGADRERQIKLMAERVRSKIRVFEIEAAKAMRRQRS
jgi:hypothetical protein